MENLITETNILDEAKECFLTYAEEVLTDRAIPSAEDGLLSVQRKILWTMEEVLKMNNSGKTKKSASIVGSTLASSYFHGDASCYGALCKMSQEYLMRYPLIQGQGSLGSQEDNDLRASARYTEAKPSKYADLMFLDYKKKVVPEKETYNGEYMEPVMLPALFPNALVNGREAIGISMAHNSMPNNLTEVCNGIINYIKKNGNITIEELMEDIKGPDFPLGGTIINKKDIKRAYETGKSTVSLKVRGDYVIEDNNIIFTSIPYRTYRNKIKEEINKNIEELDKYIDDFNDESNVGENRLIFTVKDGNNIKTALNKIFKLTSLQTTISFNMNFIVNGTPKLCSLKDLVSEYVKHQESVLLKATEYDKEKAATRLHVIIGLLASIDKIDEVIALIKSSANKTEARNNLINLLAIDSVQADAILDMKLSRLTRIDKTELIEEKKAKELIILECNKIISDKSHRDSIMIKKIEDMRDKYGDARRTKLEDIKIEPEEKEKIEVEPEKCVVVLTKNGGVKRIPSASFRQQSRNSKGTKMQEDAISAIIRTNTVDYLMIFTNRGKMYRLLVDKIPNGTNTSRPTPVSALVDMEIGEKPQVIYSIYKDTDAKYVVFVTKKGIIKKSKLEDFASLKNKKGTSVISFVDNDSLASVFLANEENVIIATENGMGIQFSLNDVSATGKAARGVKGINLKEEDFVAAALSVHDENDDLAIFFENGKGKRILLKEIPKQNRAGKGLKLGSGDKVAAISLVNDKDNILVSGFTNSLYVSAKEIPVFGRTAGGNAIIKGNISTVSKV